MKEEELLKRMPRSYRDINWRTYVSMNENVLKEQPLEMSDEDFDNYQAYCTISILLDVPLSDLDTVSYPTMIQIMNGLKFLNVAPVLVQSNYKLKDLESLTFKEFQSLIKLVEDPYNNVPDILSILLLQELTAEQINNLSIYEVMIIVEKLQKSLRKSLNRFQRSLGMQLMKLTMKQKMKNIFQIRA